MAIYEVVKKRTFVTSRIVKADSEEEALAKFDGVSSNMDPVFEDADPEEEVSVCVCDGCDECDVDY